jgi:Zn-dependent peptidase ImmA (M78 family)
VSIIKPCQYLSKKVIEQKACETLNFIEASSKKNLSWPLDTMYIAELLGLDFDFESISSDENGVIAAMIFPQKKLIIVNQDLSGMTDMGHNGFRESTIGHEIGHWILHISIDEVDGTIQQGKLDLNIYQNEEKFLCRNMDSSEDWREWQAQYFSSCLLMPYKLLAGMRSKYNLDNLSDLYRMKDEIGVTISNLKHRLKDLGWISDREADDAHTQTTLLD